MSLVIAVVIVVVVVVVLVEVRRKRELVHLLEVLEVAQLWGRHPAEEVLEHVHALELAADGPGHVLLLDVFVVVIAEELLEIEASRVFAVEERETVVAAEHHEVRRVRAQERLHHVHAGELLAHSAGDVAAVDVVRLGGARSEKVYDLDIDTLSTDFLEFTGDKTDERYSGQRGLKRKKYVRLVSNGNKYYEIRWFKYETMTAGDIAGIVIGSILLLAVIVVAVAVVSYCLRRRRRRRRDRSSIAEMSQETEETD